MLMVCLIFAKTEPVYAYKRHAYKKKHVSDRSGSVGKGWMHLWVGDLNNSPMVRCLEKIVKI